MLNRAVNTMRCMILLARKQHGGEATVLSRVLVELWLVVRWMTNKNEHNRAQQFAQFEAKQVQKVLNRLHEFDSSVNPTHKQDAEMRKIAAKYNSHIYWADNLSTMADEVEALDPVFYPRDAKWHYQVPYSISSWFVHSNAMGVRDLIPPSRKPFKFKRKEPEYVDLSVMMGALCFTLTVQRISDVLGLNIRDKVDKQYRTTVEKLLKRGIT